ncbi:hypothetical protein H0H87_004440 [Tephrocybe sp. NHM501043]|nr:hypothetical protein H0H87_004440 [Tephrocybe sp. NHM501043]
MPTELEYPDRDNPRLRGIPEEDEKRRAVFWELLNLDARMCLTPLLEATAVVDPPAYSTIVELDSSVRNFPVPKLLDELPKPSMPMQPRFLTMQRALVATTLLQLHRRFFTEVMSRPEVFDIATHPYAPSVLATCLGAANLIESIEALYDNEPELSARFLYFWFNSYSAAATLALFVARSPSTPFAPEAQKHVDRACRLFGRAAMLLPLCRRLQHVTEKLAEKSRHALKQYQSSVLPTPSVPVSPPCGDPSISADVPESFRLAHPLLLQCLERQRQRDLRYPRSPEIPHSHLYSQQPAQPGQQSKEAFLPDIYRYPYAGVNKELRYPFPFGGQAQAHSQAEASRIQTQQPFGIAQAPFVLGTPRVDANEEFNFDHGALKHCEETGYMAWF